ncbi:MAG: S9 family peptidase, partial [Anaerolineales bacterium]
GYVDNALQDIFVMRANGAELRQLTWDDGNNFNPQWSPNGQELLYQASLQPDTGDYLPRLRVINLEGQVRTIIDKWGFASSAAWLPSGEGIVFVGAPSEVLSESIYDLWLVDRDGGQPRCRTASLKSGVGALLSDDVPALPGYVYTPSLQVSPDGQAVIIQIQDGGVSHLYRVALTGLEAATPIVTGERACTVADASDTHLLFGATQMNSPMDLYIARLNGEDERPLTHLNTSLLAERALPAVEHLRFPGPDGVLVEGWFLRPPAGKAPYPTVLYIHGGPNMSYGQPFCFDFQMLVGAGYGVLIVNERGSSGYGREFAAQIVGDLGNLDYQDLMAGVDVAVARSLADPERLGCYGASAGGNLVCWIVGQTQRFKAAVAENPITNWVSYFGTTDVRSWVVEILGGRPYEIPEVYRRCSPITYAHRCITPTLLIQSENDFRCPAEQSEQFYAVLQSTGCETEMLRFPNSSHSASINGAPPIRRAQNEALLNWMNSHLLGQ